MRLHCAHKIVIDAVWTAFTEIRETGCTSIGSSDSIRHHLMEKWIMQMIVLKYGISFLGFVHQNLQYMHIAESCHFYRLKCKENCCSVIIF